MVEIVYQNYKNNLLLFNKTKSQLLELLGKNIVIEHVGSTSIPDMYGKNIIDILVGAHELSGIEINARKIESLKYYRGNNNARGEYIFFASRAEETISGDVHIHLVLENSCVFNDFLILRKYLLGNLDIAKEYSDFKHNLIKGINNREEYKLLKSNYVENLLIKAREEYN